MTVQLSRTTFGRYLRLLCVLLLAVSAAGCAKFMYNRLDTLAAWYIGDLVSLDDQQRSDLRAWLGQTLQWHRTSELGRYATFLREFSAQIAQPAGRDTFQQAFDRVEGFFGDFTAQTAPDATRLLLKLSPTQVDELLTNLEEKSNERSEKERDAIGDGTWQAKQTKSTQRQLKRWTGAISDEQKRLVDETMQHVQPTTLEWLESQRQWRAALREAFSNRDTAEKRILALLREPDTQWTTQYKTKEASNREQFLSLMTALDASLTAAQRDRMQHELTDLAERLEALTED
ncbi:MAG TPA: DUF6279 family lipoprotein [Steroidobacteraceae bacterium]|nr:DUF6279 family lipoprotein [Steroidobacteraceae bacterium]